MEREGREEKQKQLKQVHVFFLHILFIISGTDLVKLKRGKRMLFLMKMVKFSTSIIGCLHTHTHTHTEQRDGTW